MNRRMFLGAAMAATLLTACKEDKPTQTAKPKEKPVIPTDWDAKEMFEEYAAKGRGVHSPGPQGRPVAFIAFDTQCSWCMRLMDQTLPLLDKVDFVWMPVAVLTPHSEPQGAMILSAANPWEKLEEHHSQFANEAHRGLKTQGVELNWEARTAVWTNSRIFRKSAARLVPFGVMKDAKGQYQAIVPGMKTRELAKLFGITYE